MLTGTSLSGLTSGIYTVTPIVDGIIGNPESVTIADTFVQLAFDLSTVFTCGFIIQADITAGDFASLTVTGPGSPVVTGTAPNIQVSGVESGEEYQLTFIDQCGSITIFDYTVEFLFVTRLGDASLRCNIGGTCNFIDYSVGLLGERTGVLPIDYEYLVNGMVVASGTTTGNSTSFTGAIPYDCETGVTFDIEATLACGAVLTLERSFDAEIQVLDNRENCNNCITLSVPFSTGGPTTITYIDAPAGMNLAGTSFEQTPEQCRSTTTRDDFVNYELCNANDAPFEEGSSTKFTRCVHQT